MIRVLHVTAHMSGGLARVLLSTLKYAARFTPDISHEIATLGALSDGVERSFAEFADRLAIEARYDTVAAKADAADIVQVEYWNHPLIYRFFNEFDFPRARVLLCCHVSGFFRPQVIIERAVQFSDIFVGATRATEKHQLFQGAGNPLRKKIRFIRFPVDVERFRVRRAPDPRFFTVGYIGTVSYAKLHRKFLRMCADVRVENVRFVVCGEDAPDAIEAESRQYRPGLFEFTGFQDDVSRILETIDVFGYPLNPTHFGSGEQAIIEAMYFGIPVVAFSNAAESAIIEDNVSGILVDSENAYVGALEHLAGHPEERARLGENARKFVETRLSPRECFASLDRIYREMLTRPKTTRAWRSASEAGPPPGDPCMGAKLWIESLGSAGAEFATSLAGGVGAEDADRRIARVESAMKTKTKGSINQYLYFFPEDPHLNYWVGLIAQEDGRHEDAARHFRKALAGAVSVDRAKARLLGSAPLSPRRGSGGS